MAALDMQAQAELVALARSGSRVEREAAFTRLFEALRAPLYRLCFNLTGNAGDAEDALQECLLGVHQALPHFRGDAQLSTWAYRIALRSAWRVRALKPSNAVPLDAAADTPAADALPDDVAASRQEARRLSRAMQALSEEHRTVLSLFAVEGLSHSEIAAILGLPQGTVWSRLHLARKKLAVRLA